MEVHDPVDELEDDVQLDELSGADDPSSDGNQMRH
jgi:hypothetical protein